MFENSARFQLDFVLQIYRAIYILGYGFLALSNAALFAIAIQMFESADRMHRLNWYRNRPSTLGGVLQFPAIGLEINILVFIIVVCLVFYPIKAIKDDVSKQADLSATICCWTFSFKR